MPGSSPVHIRAEVSAADPDTCRFVCSEIVHPHGPFAFASIEAAAGSPLPQALFALGAIAHVLVAETVVTVTKVHTSDWGDLRTQIGAAIRAQCAAGVPAVLASVPDLDGRTVADASGAAPRDAAKIRQALEALFEREVNPRVASHGGRIEIVDVSADRLTIAMHGGCQGCASSQFTIKAGVEVMVQRVAPEITEIVDVTDHSAGLVPYLRRARQPV